MGPGKTERAGARRLMARLTGGAAAALTVAAAIAVTAVAIRLNAVWELPLGGPRRVSERTREILARTTESVRITCFIAAGHPARRPVVRLLGGLRAAASRAGGRAPLAVVVVDPRRDLAEARRLIDKGVAPDALVFEGSGQCLVVGADEMMTVAPRASGAETRLFAGESFCAAAIERLGRGGAPVVYWLTGHGEAATGDYDPQTGYSDVAREITRNGFELRDLRLWETKGVPGEAAALVVAAPQHAVAPEEAGWIQDYLNKGGRLLYLAPSRGRSGLEEVLARWGLVITPFRTISTRTLSGGDRVITAYGDHPITRRFGNTATVFLEPWCIGTASFGDVQGADRIRVTALAQTADDGWGEAGTEAPPRFEPATDIAGPVVVAAAAERGGGASADLGFKPTKVVAVGEASFVSNGMLGMRLNANRDLALNMLNWLTGIDAAAQPSLGGDAALACGLDRAGWMRVIFWVVGILPGAVLLVGGVVAIRRRRAG
jgi:hypothetical protein